MKTETELKSIAERWDGKENAMIPSYLPAYRLKGRIHFLIQTGLKSIRNFNKIRLIWQI